METDDYIKIMLPNTFTKADMLRRIRYAREFLEQEYYVSKPDLPTFLLSKHATTDDMDAMISWGDAFYKSFAKNTMYNLFNTISEKVKKMPAVNMYIPYEPVPAEIVKLGTWFRKNTYPNILIDLHVDYTLLGGCAFAWKGMYRDYSLRYFMQKRRDEIGKLISEYVAKHYQNN
jgi:hypothetical protein